jgi:hypothetical protein
MLLRAALLPILSLFPLVLSLAAEGGTFSCLQSAEAIALKIQGDEELKSAALLRLLEARLKQADAPAAERLTTAMSGHYKAMGLLLLSEQQKDKGKAHLAEAKKLLERTTGAAADTLRATFFRAKNANTKGADWLQQVTDPELRLALELEQELESQGHVTRKHVEALKPRVEAVAKGNPFPPAVQLGLQLIKRVKGSTQLNKEEQVEQVEAAVALGQLSHVAHPELVFSAATALLQLGEKEESEKLFQWAAVDTQRMPLSYEERYLSYCSWALHWAQNGDAPRAEKLLTEAETTALQHLATPEQAKVMVALAQAWQKMSKPEQAEKVCLNLLSAFEDNPNLRLRQLAAVEVLLFYLHHECLPSEPVRSALTSVEQASHP